VLQGAVACCSVLYELKSTHAHACINIYLQCVAVFYSVLQCAVACCSVLQCAARTQIDTHTQMPISVCFTVFQCVAVCCSVLQCVAACCSVL